MSFFVVDEVVIRVTSDVLPLDGQIEKGGALYR